MLIKIYKNELANLKLENKILIILSILVLLSNALVIISNTKKVVFFYPVGFCQNSQSSTEEPSREYLIAMASFIANTYLAYTPEDVEKRFASLLTLFSEKNYPKYKEKLAKMAEDIKKEDITSVFRIDDASADLKNHTIKIKGTRIFYVSSGEAKRAVETWIIKYEYKYGTFKILEINREE